MVIINTFLLVLNRSWVVFLSLLKYQRHVYSVTLVWIRDVSTKQLDFVDEFWCILTLEYLVYMNTFLWCCSFHFYFHLWNIQWKHIVLSFLPFLTICWVLLQIGFLLLKYLITVFCFFSISCENNNGIRWGSSISKDWMAKNWAFDYF